MSYTLPGNNCNRRGVVRRLDEVCRTIIGGGGAWWLSRRKRTEGDCKMCKKSMSASSRLAETLNTQHGEFRDLKPNRG